MQLDHHLGEKLCQARQATGQSLAEAAALLKIPEHQLQAYESGATRIASRFLPRAAQAFGVEIRWFFAPMPDNDKDMEEKGNRDDASTSILQSLRSNKTLSQLCEALRESDYEGLSRKSVA